ncbi:hypothetical protein C5167_036145 [Papaver somniferum]|nr:hypothetical protein C5167_036145 [Papaver somniferum]
MMYSGTQYSYVPRRFSIIILSISLDDFPNFSLHFPPLILQMLAEKTMNIELRCLENKARNSGFQFLLFLKKILMVAAFQRIGGPTRRAKGGWTTEEEDDKILELVYGPSKWSVKTKEVPGCVGKQC